MGPRTKSKGRRARSFPELRLIIPVRPNSTPRRMVSPGSERRSYSAVVVLRAEGQVAHLPGGVIVQMVGEADFLQPGVQRRLRQGAAGVGRQRKPGE